MESVRSRLLRYKIPRRSRRRAAVKATHDMLRIASAGYRRGLRDACLWLAQTLIDRAEDRVKDIGRHGAPAGLDLSARDHARPQAEAVLGEPASGCLEA